MQIPCQFEKIHRKILFSFVVHNFPRRKLCIFTAKSCIPAFFLCTLSNRQVSAFCRFSGESVNFSSVNLFNLPIIFYFFCIKQPTSSKTSQHFVRKIYPQNILHAVQVFLHANFCPFSPHISARKVSAECKGCCIPQATRDRWF